MKGFWHGRPSEIVDRIIVYAKAHPGSIPVIISDDASVVTRLVQILRECGVKKGMFEPSAEFVKAAILKSWSALASVTPYISLSVATPTGERLYWLGTGNAIPYGGVDLPERLGPLYSATQTPPDCVLALELQIDQLVDELRPFLEPH